MGRGLPVWPLRLFPMSHQEPGLFEADVVSSQLRYAGILETIRIRKEGFPIRIPFLVFIDRCLVGCGSQQGDTTKLVGVLRGSISPEDPPQWELGAPLFSAQHWEKLLSRTWCSAPWGGSVPVAWGGLRQCPGGVPYGDGVVGSPRYRCLVDMWSNVIPNGNNCVEMLRSLCPVSPSMYYVGVTKVRSPGRGWLRGSQEMAAEMGAHGITPSPSSS